MSIYLRALRAAWTEFRRTLDLDGWDGPDETYIWPEQVSHFGNIMDATGLRIGGGLGAYINSRPGSLWKVTLHREPLGDGKYRYLSGVATCVNDDRVRDVLRLEPVE